MYSGRGGPKGAGGPCGGAGRWWGKEGEPRPRGPTSQLTWPGASHGTSVHSPLAFLPLDSALLDHLDQPETDEGPGFTSTQSPRFTLVAPTPFPDLPGSGLEGMQHTSQG